MPFGPRAGLNWQQFFSDEAYGILLGLLQSPDLHPHCRSNLRGNYMRCSSGRIFSNRLLLTSVLLVASWAFLFAPPTWSQANVQGQ